MNTPQLACFAQICVNRRARDGMDIEGVVDTGLAAGIIDMAFLEGCYHLGSVYPDLCASVFVVCAPPER